MDDADYIAMVTAVQARFARKVIHVGFGGPGSRLRRACWGHLTMDGVAAGLRMRKPWIGAPTGLTEHDVDVPEPAASAQNLVGKVLKGRVENLQDYGAFIAFPNDSALPNGLLHKTEISDGDDPDVALKVLSLGQEVFVKITSMTVRGPRVSMKAIDQKTGRENPST